MLDIIASGDARLDMLKVTRRDLVSLGFKEGPEVGRMLRYLLDLVITEPRHNTAGFCRSPALRDLETRAPPVPRFCLAFGIFRL